MEDKNKDQNENKENNENLGDGEFTSHLKEDHACEADPQKAIDVSIVVLLLFCSSHRQIGKHFCYCSPSASSPSLERSFFIRFLDLSSIYLVGGLDGFCREWRPELLRR
jgi:hypothetical protein